MATHYLHYITVFMSHLSTEQLTRLRQDIHFKTTLAGVDMQFSSTWGIFSPRAIDEGSLLLLNKIEPKPTDNILDLGCGYGPLGLTLAKKAPQGKTILVDKDFVAVNYTNKNIQLNGLTNSVALLSNGFAQIREHSFDLIVSNIPAKVGNEMLWLFLHDAYEQLLPDGRLVIVTISGLSKFIKRELKEIFGNYKKLKQGKTYTVAQAVKSQSQR